MLPEDNSSYGKLSYWDERYKTEEHYDWFPSVYEPCLEQIFLGIERVFQRQLDQKQRNLEEKLYVLHLGTGNSSLVSDLYDRYAHKYPINAPYRLMQVAMDYSETVIDKMREKYHNLPDTEWCVADVRDLSSIREAYPSGFDVLIDKGTMDALQAGKEDVEINIKRMLEEVSQSVRKGSAYSQFIQITWEVPLYRLFYTLDEANDYPYAWKDNERHVLVGDSDMYRIFTYVVNP